MQQDAFDYVVVGDVGGTNVRFAIAKDPRIHSGPVVIEHFWKSPNKEHKTFLDALSAFMETISIRPKRGVFALAGPIKNNTVTLTNHSSWHVIGQDIQEHFNMERVDLLNDFAAMARSVPELSPTLGGEGFTTISKGLSLPDRPIIVAGPGTGFGLATLTPQPNKTWQVLRGEGGHQAYSPTTPLEADVFKLLQRKIGYVSIESMCAGVGFDQLLETTFEVFGQNAVKHSPAEAHELAKNGNKVCDAVCRIRANTVMTAYGDAVLASGAKGGVVAAGGVTTALIDYIGAPEALSRFFDRGPMSSYMVDVPIYLITSAEAPLLGAAAY
ncbi:glucokinase [Hirschia litorea]|uniref:Glucokinase n=1 Tax=Hirschia litorea TaxID=1199156 RepID=A0ABW2IGZ0_9PROT